MDFEASRYFFNYQLPFIIKDNLHYFNTILASLWWVFFLTTILFFLIAIFFLRKYIHKKEEFIKFDNFFNKISDIKDLNKEEKFIFDNLNISEYIAFYQLRGDTYILLDMKIDDKIGIPLRISKRELKELKKLGRYFVNYFYNGDRNFLLLFLDKEKLVLDKYRGHLNMLLTFYEKSLNYRDKDSNDSNSHKTTLSLMKLHLDKKGFFKFLVSLIKEATKAKGVKLLTKDGELVFETITTESRLQKTFYIRNTPYKLEFYNNEPLSIERVIEIGAFVDLAGSYMMNIDENSEMVKNYLKLLKLTNEAIELNNPFYKNHSKIVQIVSVETAKSLFLSQEEIEEVSLGALLHDIGMIGDLLNLIDKDKIDKKELDLIKKHPLIGAIMVEPIDHIYNISEIIKYHHERVDGLGYPFGIAGVKVPLKANIVALGEFYAGITSDRPYRKGKTHDEAIEEIKKVSDKFFEKSVVDGFLDVSEKIKLKIQRLKNE